MRQQLRLRSPDCLAARRHDRAQAQRFRRQHTRQPQINRLRCEHQPRPAQTPHGQRHPPGRCSIPRRGVPQPAGRTPRQASAGISQVEHRHRHPRQRRIKRKRIGRPLAAHFSLTARKADADRREQPCRPRARHHRRGRQRDRAPIKRAVGGNAVTVGRHIGGATQGEGATARATRLCGHTARAVLERGGKREPTQHQIATSQPRAVRAHVYCRAIIAEQGNHIQSPPAQAHPLHHRGVIGVEMRLDSLIAARDRQPNRAARRAAHVELPVNPALDNA